MKDSDLIHKREGVNWSVIWGAAFLMATTAVGPGFLTQTSVFTEQLLASFGFVILVSIILDIGVQLNIWRIVVVSERRAQDIANLVLPGLGFLVSFLIVSGGFVLNVGNLAGTGLGLNILFPSLTVVQGAIISALFAIIIFLVKEAGKVMDRFVLFLGFVMIILTVYVAFTSSPPIGEATYRTFIPETIDTFAIITLVGGTVGGFISFAGAHRLIDGGIRGSSNLSKVNRGAVSAIGVASIIRIILFLAALGVVSQGFILDEGNPAASVFQLAAGEVGYKIFGVVMWAAAITSVVGCSYTSISFIQTFHPLLYKYRRWIIVGFILLSTMIFSIVGRPVTLLVIAGAANGLILPITLSVMLIAVRKKNIVGDYKHPVWMTIFGILIVLLMTYMSIKVISGLF